MSPSSQGIFIIDSEISIVLMAMKRGNLWNSNSSQDTNTENLIKELMTLKKSLTSITSFNELNTVEFLMPFLDVIRSEDVSGHVTALAINSVNKFLSYDLIDCGKSGVKIAVENLADAVTHARFVGTDSSSDEVVLMKIIDVMRQMTLSKVGLLLTNESICEIMQSTLRICFEPRLSELLRRTAQHCLNDMVQLLFTRLPSFTLEQKPLLKKLKMRSGGLNKGKRKRGLKKSQSPNPAAAPSEGPVEVSNVVTEKPEEVPVTVPSTITEKSFISGDVLARSPVGSVQDLSLVSDGEADRKNIETGVQEEENPGATKDQDCIGIHITSPEGTCRQQDTETVNADPVPVKQEFTNDAGVTFESTADMIDSEGSLIPYGLPAVYELLRFLASLINPHEPANTEAQINIGLSLVITALEVGVSYIEKFPSLLSLVQDSLCRSFISLLDSERVGVFSSSLRCCFLIFGVLRPHLKLQLESFLSKLADLITSESLRISYEQKELGLELLVQLYKLPGFVTELYLNYDCGLYTANLFEELTKVLSKNAFPQDRNILTTHYLALEGLMVVLDQIEKHCQRRISDRVPQPPQFSPSKKVSRDTVKEMPTSTTLMTKVSGHIFGKQTLAKEENPSQESGPVRTVSPQAVPTHESLMAIKHKKKLFTTGTDQFNVKPSKGISYLQEARLLSNPLDALEVAQWLRENPHLDKNMIGEYISNKKNLEILKAFVKSFDFTGMRIDEALRMFLQTFRLPGEAPVISNIMEIFGEHWHQYAKAAGQGLADEDSPYTLAYAVIMLNTDQHNPNAGKNNLPMTQEQFIRNLRGTNGGGDHDPATMAEVYQAIKNEEIVMPSEQTGTVKENYLWKMLLTRSLEEDEFILMDNGLFDHNLFGLAWGPAVASLSYIYDKSYEPEVQRRAVDGFSKCAMIAAHYAMSDVLDNLILSLSKFSMLTKTTEPVDSFKVSFGSNSKAQLATRALFSLTHKYGDIMREGWRNIIESLLQLFKCQLLPDSMMMSEDFIEPSGSVSLFREELPVEKEDSGLINSLVSFIVASSEMPRELTQEEREYVIIAKKTIAECHPDHMLQESKFLLTESLSELIKFLVSGSVLDSGDSKDNRSSGAEHAAVFYLELITRITIANRDRVHVIWRVVNDHLHRMISASARTLDTHFQLERAVTSLLRLGVRLARKEDLASLTVQSLRILLAIKPGSILHICKHVSYGLHEMLKNNAANIHSGEDWNVIFTLLEVVGAGASPDVAPAGRPDEDSGQGGTDEENNRERGGSGGWVDLGREGGSSSQGYSIVHTRQIVMHSSVSYLKCCETLSFLVRDVVHITPENFSSCVAAIRTFVEASYRGDNIKRSAKSAIKKTQRNKPAANRMTRSEPRHGGYEADESSDEELVCEYTHVTLQLLDLMHVLLTRAMGVQTAWEKEPADLWDLAWCPVLQGMARLCCDTRPQVRTQSLTLLQRSLLVPDLQVLSPAQWEFAFLRVLFPMLRKLLELGREDTKLRAAMMLSKVFLQHLSPLSSLPTFSALWLSILDIIGQFCTSASSDLLADALPESLKNMLLVMDTSGRGLFFTEQGQPTPLWGVTWGKIDSFLPTLRDELFPDWEKRAQQIPTSQPADGGVEKEKNEKILPSELALPPPANVEPPQLEASAPPATLPQAGNLSSLPASSTVSSSIPTSPLDPPVMPCTAFSLPTSPSHLPGSLIFTPISLPVQVSPALVPLVSPRPVLATPTPGWRPQSPTLVPGLGQTSDSTAFSNPLLSSAPPNIGNLPQFVASPSSNPDLGPPEH